MKFYFGLQLPDSIFGRSKLDVQLVHYRQSFIAMVVRDIGSMLKHGNESLPGHVGRIAPRARLLLRRKFSHFFGYVLRALDHCCRLPIPS